MSSRTTAERFSCRLRSTRAGRRPPSSSGRPRRPASARRIRTGSHGLSRPNLTALQGRWRASVSKSDTKEPRCRRPGKQNVGIMRFLRAGSVPFWAFVSDLDIVGRSAPEGGRATLLRRNSAAARDSTEGWDAPASHPSVSAQSRMTGSSRVQFFEWRARSSRYPPTTATLARPKTSSALVPV